MTSTKKPALDANQLKIRKAETLKGLNESGEVHRKHQTPYWEAAFKLYWEATGDKTTKPGCGACYNTVLAWLKQ